MSEGIHVAEPGDGYLCSMSIRVRLPTDPDTAYKLLTDPDNARMFRNIEDCPYRQVLVNDKKTGRQRVEVEHAAGWRLMMFRGQFKTRLIVEQDSKARIMTFTLKPGTGGIMRKFEGTWYIRADTESDDAKGPSSIATLRQQIMPLIHGPGLDWIVTGVSKRQLGNLVEDLKAEVQRLNAGKPIPANQLKKPARNWKAAELQGFALDFSDSDDDTEDAAEEQQKSKRPSQDAAVDSWPLLAAAMQAEGVDTGTTADDAKDAAEPEQSEEDVDRLAEALKEAARVHGVHPDVTQLLDNEWHRGSSPPKN